MARYFCGNSFAGFFRNTSSIVEGTFGGSFNSSFVANSISFLGSNQLVLQTPVLAPITGTVWVKGDLFIQGGSSPGGVFTLLNGSTGAFRVTNSGSFFQCQYWNGAAWVNTGGTFVIPQSNLTTLTARVTLNSGFELFENGLSTASGSGWSGSPTQFDRAQFYNAGSLGGGNSYWSQIMMADYDIRDSRYAVTVLNANSLVNTGGSGAYTDVQKAVINDGTAVNVATVGNKQGQTHAPLTVPIGYRIAAMVISGRGRATGGTVVDGKLGIRTAGGVNNSGSALGYTSGYEPRQRIIDNDPDTGVPFLEAGYNGAQIYEEGA